MVSAFSDKNPRGFGLLQRDRVFDHYLDGVYYDRRPSLWVEPLGPRARLGQRLGAARRDPDRRRDPRQYRRHVGAGEADRPTREVDLRYRLHWLADEPYPSELARCVATRLGNGGQPGQPRPKGVRKFMVEFLGGPLANLPFGVKPEPVLRPRAARSPPMC